MQNVKDFLVKYKRYLGASVLFIFLVVVLVSCTGPKSENGKDVKNTQTGTEVTPTEYVIEGELEKNTDPEVVELMENYYKAYANGDIETLEFLAQPFSDNEKEYVRIFSECYEEYQNIECYSMPGATEDSFLVFVSYGLKFYEADTPAPGMEFFYVERNGKGNLCINNAYSVYNFNFSVHEYDMDEDLYAMVLAGVKSSEVAKLQQDVQSRYDEAVKSDEKLANIVGGTLRSAMEKWHDFVNGNNQESTEKDTQTKDTQETKPEDTQKEDAENTEKNDPDTEKNDPDSEKDDSDSEPQMVKTNDICNVRKKPSTDADILGRVDAGAELEKIGTKGEWTKVKFQGKTGYIKSDLLKNVKK